MNKNLDILTCFGITLGSVLLVELPIPIISPFIKFVAIVLLQGWLLSEIIFSQFSNLHLVLQVLLIFVFGSLLLSFELWMMIIVKLPINQNSTLLSGASASLLMQLAVIYKRSLSKTDGGKRYSLHNLNPLFICAGVSMVFAFLIWYSIPIAQEHYTAFYVQSDNNPSSVSGGVFFIENHEGSSQTYILECTDSGNTMPLFQVPSPSNTTVRILYQESAPNPTPKSKIQISLSISERLSRYRTIEIPGDNCGDLKLTDFTVSPTP